MQLLMGQLDLLIDGSQAGHQLLGRLAFGPVQVLAEPAFGVVQLHGKLGHPAVGQQRVDLVGPVQVVDFALGQFAVQLVSGDDLLGITGDVAKAQETKGRRHNEQGYYQTEAQNYFAAHSKHPK
jgi:hypothetical protein